jgi:hypothetical protein
MRSTRWWSTCGSRRSPPEQPQIRPGVRGAIGTTDTPHNHSLPGLDRCTDSDNGHFERPRPALLRFANRSSAAARAALRLVDRSLPPKRWETFCDQGYRRGSVCRQLARTQTLTVLPRERALCDPRSAMHGWIRVQARVGGAWTPSSRVVGPRHHPRNTRRAPRRSCSRIAIATVLEFRGVETSQPPTLCLCIAMTPSSGTMLLPFVRSGSELGARPGARFRARSGTPTVTVFGAAPQVESADRRRDRDPPRGLA